MWDPGFEYQEMRVARLYGYHRVLCIYAWTYRGTPEYPGLVLGLDAGGSCVGRAYRVLPDKGKKVLQYLDARETPDIEASKRTVDVYRKKWVRTQILGGGAGPQKVTAVCYVADPRHQQYSGKLSFDEQAKCVLQGRGTRGSSFDYLENTIRHLDELGIADGPLQRLWDYLRTKR
jgi:cation transport protein ChaC